MGAIDNLDALLSKEKKFLGGESDSIILVAEDKQTQKKWLCTRLACFWVSVFALSSHVFLRACSEIENV